MSQPDWADEMAENIMDMTDVGGANHIARALRDLRNRTLEEAKDAVYCIHHDHTQAAIEALKSQPPKEKTP